MAWSLKEIEQAGDLNEQETMWVKVFFDGIQEMAKAYPEFKSVMQSIRESQSFSPKRKHDVNSEDRKKSDTSKWKSSVISYLNTQIKKHKQENQTQKIWIKFLEKETAT